MSTIAIRFEDNPRTGVPRRAAVLIVDGVRIETGPHPFTIQCVTDAVELPPSVDDPGAEGWRTYMPGVRTYTLARGDALVMMTNDAPERRDLDDGMVEFVWRNVALAWGAQGGGAAGLARTIAITAHSC